MAASSLLRCRAGVFAILIAAREPGQRTIRVEFDQMDMSYLSATPPSDPGVGYEQVAATTSWILSPEVPGFRYETVPVRFRPPMIPIDYCLVSSSSMRVNFSEECFVAPCQLHLPVSLVEL